MGRRSLGLNYRKLFAATTISNLGDGVSLIAYPWLATAVTRNPLLIALVAVVQRLPWLLFTLPAGVITDRHDRRRLMVGANVIRFVITALVALAVLARGGALPAPDEVDSVVGTEWFLYLVLLIATLLLGTCEVLHDNSAQTFLPAVVDDPDLEQANGQMYSAEIVANQFAGPAARQPHAGHRVRAADPVRRRVVRRSPPGWCSASSPPARAEPAAARPSAGRSSRSSPRGSAGCGTTPAADVRHHARRS